ncbi:MAG: hypothetical protein IJ957_02880, partial [Rikenellaceae bacterium]|nr:hypothetical protein [Rikenellaceae bacterium]
MEGFCRENHLQLKVYAIANNGYIEGVQSEALLQVFHNFCVRSGLIWGGGIGVGGGVMLNVMRIVFCVQIGILFLNMFLSGTQTGNWLPAAAFENFADLVEDEVNDERDAESLDVGEIMIRLVIALVAGAGLAFIPVTVM